jgi:NTP pyrophosphatase (non-canonical NTP hydrolase)
MTEPLTLDEYQDRTAETAIYPRDAALVYLALGMVSEAGEFAGHVKKLIRGDFPDADISKPESLPFDVRAWLIGEIGDQLWYLAQASAVLGISLGEVGEQNLRKLAERKGRGVLHGSGDTR